MNHPPEWTEEQVAAALADLLDQPQPTTDNPALQPYLETFQQLHALSEAPQEFFQKDLAWLIIGQQLQQPKKVNLRPWLARLRSALTVSWRPSPRLALGLTVIIIAIGAWLFWPINPPQTLPQPQNLPEGYVVMESRSMAMSFYEPANRFEILTTLGIQGLSDFEAYQYRLSQEQSQPAVAPPPVVETSPTTNGTNAAATQSQTRMVQQEANLNVIVVDVPAVVEQITELAFAKGGYLTSLESGQTSNSNPIATIQLRVPVEQFFSTLTDIKELGLEVVSENITSEDVTSRYVDLNARLHNLQITETEIGELLITAQDRGESSQEILRIYDDLNGVREEIEVLQGQIQYLEQTVAMSLISVNLATEPEEIKEDFKPSSFDAGETAQEAWVNFVNIWQDIATVLIWLGIHSPFILLPLGIVWIIRYRNRTNQPR